MKKKSLNLVASFSRGPDKENSYYEDKIDELQERNLWNIFVSFKYLHDELECLLKQPSIIFVGEDKKHTKLPPSLQAHFWD